MGIPLGMAENQLVPRGALLGMLYWRSGQIIKQKEKIRRVGKPRFDFTSEVDKEYVAKHFLPGITVHFF